MQSGRTATKIYAKKREEGARQKESEREKDKEKDRLIV